MKLDLRNFLDLEPVGAVLEDLDTPVPVIDIGIGLQRSSIES